MKGHEAYYFSTIAYHLAQRTVQGIDDRWKKRWYHRNFCAKSILLFTLNLTPHRSLSLLFCCNYSFYLSINTFNTFFCCNLGIFLGHFCTVIMFTELLFCCDNDANFYFSTFFIVLLALCSITCIFLVKKCLSGYFTVILIYI